MKLSILSSLFATALTLAVGSTTATSTSTYTLLHRITTFSSTPEWTIRARLDLSSNGTLVTLLDSSAVKALQEQAWSSAASEQFYQLALREDESEVGFTSVKLCLLRQSHAELPTLDDEVTITTRGSKVIGLGYRVRDITLGSDGCPVKSDSKMAKVREERRKERQRQLSRRRSSSSSPPSPPSIPPFSLNTKLSIARPATAKPIALKQAAPTNEDGTVQVPPPEKSFVQKYWYYAIPLVILLIMPDGQDERAQGAEGHGSSEHRGTGMGAKKLN